MSRSLRCCVRLPAISAASAASTCVYHEQILSKPMAIDDAYCIFIMIERALDLQLNSIHLTASRLATLTTGSLDGGGNRHDKKDMVVKGDEDS